MDTPEAIRQLLIPSKQKPQGKKSWGIDLETTWLPFFTATNAMGQTAIPSASIGCPLRLGYDKTGEVRFSQNGKPVIRIDKDISDSVKMVRDNMVANLHAYTGKVIAEHSDNYKAVVETSKKAGEPVYQHDKTQLALAIARLEAIAKVEAEVKAEVEAKAKAKAEVEVKAEVEAKAVKSSGKVKELVTA